MIPLTCLLLSFLMIGTSAFEDNAEDTELQLVVIMFRHGDRFNDLKELKRFPQVTKTNSSISISYGNLTRKGQVKMYNTGLMYRKMYNDFLGDELQEGVVIPYTSNVRRTNASMLAFLAGFEKPPRKQLQSILESNKIDKSGSNSTDNYLVGTRNWELSKIWGPNPYITNDVISGELNGYFDKRCPALETEFLRVINLPEIKEMLTNNSDLFEYLNQVTGANLLTLTDMAQFALTIEIYTISLEVERPEYTVPVWDRMLQVLDFDFLSRAYTNKQKRLSVGSITKRILDEMIEKTLNISKKKTLIFSAHDLTISALYALLGGEKGFIDAASNPAPVDYPIFGASIVLELHKIKSTNKYAVKILYDNKNMLKPEPLKLVDCDLLCPLEKIINMTKSLTLSRSDQIEECKAI